MPSKYYWTCVWPGLSELWWRGRLSGLSPAITFAALLNLILIVRFIYPTWLPGFLVSLACWVGIGIWIYLVQKSVRELPGLLAPRAVSEQPDQYDEACLAYLRGKWEKAEPILLGMLAVEPRDPPSLLLLSGVYRHTGRAESAGLLISELQRLEIADAWQIEIDAEVSRIDRDLAQKADETNSENSAKNDLSSEPDDAAGLAAA